MQHLRRLNSKCISRNKSTNLLGRAKDILHTAHKKWILSRLVDCGKTCSSVHQTDHVTLMENTKYTKHNYSPSLVNLKNYFFKISHDVRNYKKA